MRKIVVPVSIFVLVMFVCSFLEVSPLPPGPKCVARVEVIKRTKRIYDSPMLLAPIEMKACRVRLLQDVVDIEKGYQGQSCAWSNGDIINDVVIEGGFDPPPKCEPGEIIEGVLQPAGDEGGTWVNLKPIKVPKQMPAKKVLLFSETVVDSMFGGGASLSLYNTGELIYEFSSEPIRKAQLASEQMVVIQGILTRLAAAKDCAQGIPVMDASKRVRIILDGVETVIDNPDMNHYNTECYKTYEQIQGISRLLPSGREQ